MPNAPSGLIIVWPSTVASIPAGWVRVTAMDGLYLVLTRTNNQAGQSIGSALHTHTGNGHSHSDTVEPHLHTFTGTSAASGTQPAGNARAGTTVVAAPQGHVHPITGKSTYGIQADYVQSVNVTFSSSTNECPAWLTVIWIRSNGSTGIPANAVVFAEGALSGYARLAAANTRGIKGATTGMDGGDSGGSDHSHTPTPHTHTNSHSHVPVATNAWTASSTVEVEDRGYGDPGVVTQPHWHSILTDLTSLSSGVDSPASWVSNTDQTWPLIIFLLAAQNTSGGELTVTDGIIGFWDTNPLSTIPNGWQLCGNADWEGRCIGGAPTDATIGSLGGTAEPKHLHTSIGHTHTVPSHTHAISLGDWGTGQKVYVESGVYPMNYHIHGTGTCSASNASSSLLEDSTSLPLSSNTMPLGRKVYPIKYIGQPPIRSVVACHNRRTGQSVVADADGSTTCWVRPGFFDVDSPLLTDLPVVSTSLMSVVGGIRFGRDGTIYLTGTDVAEALVQFSSDDYGETWA